MPTILRRLAHARTGDKGDVSNISVIAYDPRDYARLERHVTAERVAAHFAGLRVSCCFAWFSLTPFAE